LARARTRAVFKPCAVVTVIFALAFHAIASFAVLLITCAKSVVTARIPTFTFVAAVASLITITVTVFAALIPADAFVVAIAPLITILAVAIITTLFFIAILLVFPTTGTLITAALCFSYNIASSRSLPIAVPGAGRPV
jgi:hypothetical protein